MLVELPGELRAEIEQRLEGIPLGDLTRAVADLSERYRSGARLGTRVSRAPMEVLAYAVARLPATYAALTAALARVRRERADWHPRTVLDLGAGLGAGIWAAAATWDALVEAVAVEADPSMIELGRSLARASSHPVVAAARWIGGDFTRALSLPRSDLVLMGYVLGEIEPGAIETAVQRAWDAARDTLVIVEPGTPAGYARMIQARDKLIGAGGYVIAPCPHDAPCPMFGSDWCHFAVRLPRSRVHRLVKEAELGYEDEKFSYLALSRRPSARPSARVVRHPLVRPGRIQLTLCTRRGIQSVVITRSDRVRFRQARKIEWGDAFEEAEGPGEEDP
jgi:ribosomal protein RSM22 (predicted rRNA methylase)